MSRLNRETNPSPGYNPALLPQHEKQNGQYVPTGEVNPLPVKSFGLKLEEQLTQTNAVSGVLTFSVNLNQIEIYNMDNTNSGVFNVNGINITVPPGKVFKAAVGGTPRKTVNISGSTQYIVGRYQ